MAAISPRLPGIMLWLLLLALNAASFADATYWTVTYYKVRVPTTYTDTLRTSKTYTGTFTQDIRTASATPTATPYLVSTTVSYGLDLTIVNVYYEDEDVPAADIATTTDSASAWATGTIYSTVYQMPTIFTAPSACERSFTFVTTVSMLVPPQVTQLYTPVSLVTRPYVGYDSAVTAYLETNAITKASTENSIWLNYIQSCTYPPTTTFTTTPSGSISRSSSITTTGMWIIIVGTIVPFFFLLGFVESWFWFRRLMLGKSSLRGGTVCWIAMTIVWFWLTRRQRARPSADRFIMRKHWIGLRGKDKFRLWLRWGFIWTYPIDLLGDPADSAGQRSKIELTRPVTHQSRSELTSPSDYQIANKLSWPGDIPEPKSLVLPGQDKYRGAPSGSLGPSRRQSP